MMTAMKYALWAIDKMDGKRKFFYGNDLAALARLGRVLQVMAEENYFDLELHETSSGRTVSLTSDEAIRGS